MTPELALAPDGPCSDSSLLLARVSGLPATTIQQFSSDLCRNWLAAHSSLERELGVVRAELVERLYELVRFASPGLRRLLLSVKRAAFNGQDLSPQKADSRWSELADRVGPSVDRLSALEERLESWREGYSSAYRQCREREHRALLATLDDSGFRRGLALASPVLAEAAERTRRNGIGAPSSRRESRLDHGLLRYASRAALKLSPFSTLTRIAVARVDKHRCAPLAWAAGAWKERSTLRVQRYLIEQDIELLCRYRPFREGLELTLNPTLERASLPEGYRFIRPERRVADTQAGKLRYESAALAEINLPPSLTAGVLDVLSKGPWSYRSLATALAAELGGFDAAAAVLDSLIDAGVLLLLTPWPSNEPLLERALLAHLRTLPPDTDLTAVIGALESLVALEEGFPATATPGRSVAEIDRTLDDLWHSAALLAGIEPGIKRARNRSGDFCEDVLLLPAEAGERQALRVSQAAVREIVRSAAPWARLTAFQGYRLDFLYTISAFLRRRWPGRGKVGFLELFRAAQPVWREYRKLTASATGGWQSAFNPLGLEEVATLASVRTKIWAGLQDTLSALPPGERLPLEALERLASWIPRPHSPSLGPCLFVQPADAAGGLWVLNRIFEGTGRYGSRFTNVMDEETRRQFVSQSIHASVREIEGEPFDLLDLMWSHQDTLNVHDVQTARVLAIPGETLDRRAAEAVELGSLHVSLDGPASLPRLVDDAGRSFLPIHLGGAACRLMPFLIQFLAQWGPGELRPLRPPRAARRDGSVQVWDRLTTGCLVLARRRWMVPLGEDLRRHIAVLDEEEAFLAINRWRMGHGLPEQLFLIEKTHYESLGEVYKPQFLDFTSPLFVEIFRSALRLNGDPLTFEEALPGSRDLPDGPRRDQWAVELQLETLSLQRDDLPEEPTDVLTPTSLAAREIRSTESR